MGWPDLANRIQVAAQSMLGEAATFYPADGSASFAIVGIFDAAHVRTAIVGGQLGGSESIEIGTAAPVLSVHLGDFPASPEAGARLEVRSQLYRVTAVEPDGQGDADLVLEVAP